MDADLLWRTANQELNEAISWTEEQVEAEG